MSSPPSSSSALGRRRAAVEAVAAATDALATAGLQAIGGTESADGTALADAFARAGSAVACIAAGEAASDDAIAETAAVLRAAGARFVLFQGSGKRRRTEAAGIDANLAKGGNLVAILGKTLDAIADAGKKMQNQVVDQKAGGSES